MKISQIVTGAATVMLMLSTQACSRDKANDGGGKLKVDNCPTGVESLWYTDDSARKALAISRIDGVMHITLAGYEEQIVVNGKQQSLTPKGDDNQQVTVTANCEVREESKIIRVSEKSGSGKEWFSEWSFDAEKGTGVIAVVKDDEIKQEIPLVKSQAIASDGPF